MFASILKTEIKRKLLIESILCGEDKSCFVKLRCWACIHSSVVGFIVNAFLTVDNDQKNLKVQTVKWQSILVALIIQQIKGRLHCRALSSWGGLMQNVC